MTPRESYLQELRNRTTNHLNALAEESAETFGRYIALPELGARIYQRLVSHFQMDGAQEISATLVDLFSGALDTGSVLLNDREYRGLSLVLEEYGGELPDGPRRSLQDLITTLRKADS
jgi:hypothetical protein